MLKDRIMLHRLLTEEEKASVKRRIKGFDYYTGQEWENLALMIGVDHPLHDYIKMFIKMNEVNFKK